MAAVRPWTDVPRQDGRRFVVTGANSGVGLALTQILASRGARVVMACRTPAKASEAAAGVRPTGGGGVEIARLDLADLALVRAFAAEVGDVDVLVNNAGIMGVPFTRSADGFELQFATNHLGHFALANLLLPRVSDRVVVVSSQSHRGAVLDLDDLDWQRRGYRHYAAYGQSKLANMLFLAELSRRLTAIGSTVRVTGAHPGSTSTGITSSNEGFFGWLGSFGHQLVGMPPWQGALPTAYAATMDVPTNSYFGPHGLHEMTGWPTPVGRAQLAADPDLAARLWRRSEELTGVQFPLSRS